MSGCSCAIKALTAVFPRRMVQSSRFLGCWRLALRFRAVRVEGLGCPKRTTGKPRYILQCLLESCSDPTFIYYKYYRIILTVYRETDRKTGR